MPSIVTIVSTDLLFKGIPDVSAQSDFFRIFFEGQPGLIGGTSASSPTFAGFVSLLNDVRLSNRLPPLGFLNPFLYSTGQAGLTDITVGNNPGCGTEGFNVSLSLLQKLYWYSCPFTGYNGMGPG